MSENDINGLLHQAAHYDNVDLMESLLIGSESESINEQDVHGRTPLYTSIANNSLKCCHLLLMAGANPNIACTRECSGMTPLHIAARDNKEKFLDLLLDYGADVNVFDDSGCLPMDVALQNNNFDCMESIQMHVDLESIRNIEIETTFQEACKYGNVQLAQSIMSSSSFTSTKIHALINATSEQEHDLLYCICRSGHAGMCEYLLGLGAEVRVEPLSGLSPVHIACLAGHLDCVDVLLKTLPFQVTVPTSDGYYPLHLASMQGHVEVAKLLVAILLCHSGCLDVDSSFANETFESALNFRDGKGNTCLHLAVECGSLELVEYFLGLKKPNKSEDSKTSSLMQVDAFDDQGRTALHLSILKSTHENKDAFLKVLEILLKHGANPNAKYEKSIDEKETSDSSALMEAIGHSNREAIRLLLKYGAKDGNMVATKMAIKNNDHDLIEIFLWNQISFDAENVVSLEEQSCETCQGQDKMSFRKHKNDQRSSYNFYPGVKVDWNSLGLLVVNPSWLQRGSNDWDGCSICVHSITELDLSHNLLKEWPYFIWQLIHLKKLNLSNNQIEIIRVTKSQDVQISENSILSNSESAFIQLDRQIPETFTFDIESQDSADLAIHKCLEEIDLKSNKLKNIPSVVFDISSLKRLNLSFNKLTSLPMSMWSCSSLVEFNASHNLLPELPYPSDSYFCKNCRETPATVAGSFSSEDSAVMVFDGEGSHGDFYDDELCYSRINNWQDKVKVQPSYFVDDYVEADAYKSTSHLKELNISFNLFEEIPCGLPCFAYRLEKLFLSNNQITRFGNVQSYPASLEVLDLSRNQISEEETFRRMSSVLPVSTGIPRICKSPLCLTNSYSPTNSPLLMGCRMMSRCSITSLSNLSVPLCVSPSCVSHACHLQLTKLKTLLLSFNCLKNFSFACKDDFVSKSLPSDGLRTPSVLFPNLMTLDLSNNLITIFPKEIGHLRNLSTLTMANNRIVQLPKEVGFLKKLWSLNFVGNPVNETLKSLLGDRMRVVKAVVCYMRSIMDEVVSFNHLKLMVVGRQGAGKTSLLQILAGENAKNSHWISRRDKNMKGKAAKGENLSTVGVDIGDLVIKRENEEAVFSTWDFGGQNEYYATHQYFLSKRSIYLVVWKITDAEKGINEIFRWLINIQARAPSSCVILVGTHLDLALKNFSVKFLEEITVRLEKRYIKLAEPGRWGFPKIIGHVMVNCKPGTMSKADQVRLHQIIWRAVDMTLDNIGSRVLDQKVPVNYIHLQKTIRTIAKTRKESNNDPVLTADQYKQVVIETMEENYGASFQDLTELNQATQFLHENGFLLHYDDTNLRDIYFLDPQWLCDMLACIVTVKQINGLAIDGVMKLDDLPILLKGVAFKSKDIKKYMINLLHKFEVALQWDDVHLLIPSLLPLDKPGLEEFVMIPVTNEESISSNLPGNSKSSSPPLSGDINNPLIFRNANSSFSFLRLYTMSYFPAGFWPRLITRMLGDPSYFKLLKSLYDLSVLSDRNVDIDNLPGSYWHCWQTGLDLRHLGLPVLRVKEVSTSTSLGLFDYFKYNPVTKEESDCTWYSAFTSDVSILEVVVYNESFGLKPCDENDALTIFPETETAVRLLTVVVEQIDTLLEDWYPSVGTRFTKDIKGAMLINRLVPCTKCLMDHRDDTLEEKIEDKMEGLNKQENSLKIHGFLRDCDSPSRVVYCFSIEHCIHVAQSNKVVSCPRHGNLGPYCTADEKGRVLFNHIAPDTVFYDLPRELVVPPDDLQRTKFLGKGAFGAVYVGLIHLKQMKSLSVAIKLLRPIVPEEEIPVDLYRLFQKECDLWTRDPILKCCEAYMVARKELSILLNLKHDHVVSLVGICISPPCLILSLAPLGCLNDHLKSFRKSCLKLPLYAIRNVTIQVASALGYLHSKHIIYRDLKSENILVWSFPDWKSVNPVDVKLADYGVSRVFSPSGTKGYAGTLPFMAPEILVQNGEEIYSEKVDCYSFSLLIYELVSLKMPYEGDMLLGTCGINLKSHVLAGGRPVLLLKEARRPSNILDLMTLCWSPDPQERLSASDIELFARQPEFCSLLDAVKLNDSVTIVCATSVVQHDFIKIPSQPWQEALSEVLMYGVEKDGPKIGSLFAYTFSKDGLGHIRKLKSTVGRVVSMHSMSGFIWCATDQSVVHILRFPEYSELMKFSIAEPPTSITCICEVQGNLCAVLDNGMFVLCSLNVSQDQTSNMGITVIKYPGNGRLVHCVLYSCINDQHFLWSGQTQGSLSLWELVGESLQHIQSFHHSPRPHNLSDTVHITSEKSQSLNFFTYVYPGSFVYKWSSKMRCIEGSIDLSLNYPLLADDRKMFIEQTNQCTVTCMSVIGGTLYITTSFGSLLGINPASMSCIFVCRISNEESPSFCAILSLCRYSEKLPEFRSNFVSQNYFEKDENSFVQNHLKLEKCFFATVVPGYRCLKDAINSFTCVKDDLTKYKSNFYVVAWSDEVFRQSVSYFD